MWPRTDGMRTLSLGTPGPSRARLNSLVLAGAKRATAGLLTGYATEGEELETPGEHLALVDDHDQPVAVVEVTGVRVTPFGQVPWEFAAAEGEGDTSIEDWRAGHLRYWGRQGERVDEHTDIVCLTFRPVPLPAAACRDRLSVLVGRLVSLFDTTDPATPVPTCPGWDLAGLAGHLGTTHRWVTAMLVDGSTEKARFRPFRDQVPADPAALPGWLADGAQRLLAALADTPPERPVWTVGPQRVAGAWSRRMLHEATVHHVDAELALGRRPTVPRLVAVDGVDEFLDVLRGLRRATPDDGRVGLVATDLGAGWLVGPGDGGPDWRRTGADADADAVVSGTAEELYLFAYGRVPAPATRGDTGLLARWTAATVF